jgi:hypothetical protein
MNNTDFKELKAGDTLTMTDAATAVPKGHNLHNRRSMTCGVGAHHNLCPKGRTDRLSKSCLSGSFPDMDCRRSMTCGYENIAFQAKCALACGRRHIRCFYCFYFLSFFNYFGRKGRIKIAKRAKRKQCCYVQWWRTPLFIITILH